MLNNLIEPASHTTWPTDNKLALEVNYDFLDHFGSLGGLGKKEELNEREKKTVYVCQQK